MPLFGGSTESKALDVLRGLHAQRGKLEAAITEHETDLAQLRAGVSEDAALDAFLAGGPAVNADGFPTSGRLRAGAIEDQLTDLRGARAALCRRIRAGLVDLGKARGGELRKQAAKLQTELDKHLARSAELLNALQDHTRARYAPDRIGDADILTDAAGRESVFRRGDRPMPRSQELASEIAMLHRKAEAAEARAKQATEGGQVAGENLESLLAVCADVERLAPTEAAVRAWFEQASAKAEAEWAATALDYAGVNTSDGRFQPAPDHDTVYTLAWNTDGVIDLARSTAKNRPNLARLPIAASVGPASDGRRW